MVEDHNNPSTIGATPGNSHEVIMVKIAIIEERQQASIKEILTRLDELKENHSKKIDSLETKLSGFVSRNEFDILKTIIVVIILAAVTQLVLKFVL